MEVQVCNFQERHWCHLLSEYKDRGSVGTATARAQDILSPSWAHSRLRPDWMVMLLFSWIIASLLSSSISKSSKQEKYSSSVSLSKTVSYDEIFSISSE
ncbi:hypothetical protein LEMLEM_LOCUS25427 [Lemmus lemmus]